MSETVHTPDILPLPTTVIYGPKGRIIVNTIDLKAWLAKGYSETPTKVKAEATPAPEAPKKG